MKSIITLLLLTVCTFGQLSGEARILKEKRDAKIAEIDKIYFAELTKLKLKALQDLDTVAVEAIQKELGEETVMFKQVVQSQDPLAQIIGRWKRSGMLTSGDGDILEFVDEKNGFFIDENRGRYGARVAFRSIYNSTTKEITIRSSEWKNKIILTGDPDTLEGVAGEYRYKLTRIK
jgi:hypothetical protein